MKKGDAKEGDLVEFTVFRMFNQYRVEDAREVKVVAVLHSIERKNENAPNAAVGNMLWELKMHKVIWSDFDEWRGIGGNFVLTDEQFEQAQVVIPTPAQMLVWGI